ncbi:AfsR/SARP family transcriptional regulator [Flindersiella endophytica]
MGNARVGVNNSRAAVMDFRVLGRLGVSFDGRSIDSGTPKQRTVLAALLLDANEVVSNDRLIDSVWWDPPPAARANLRAYITGLRRSLHVSSDKSSRLHTERAGGYRLTVFPQELDLDQFKGLVSQSEEELNRGRLHTAANKLSDALRLWRGPVLDGLLERGPALEAKAASLEDQRASVAERWARLKLSLRQPDPVLPQLRVLVKEHPLREPLWALLMLALCAAGRHSEALSAYADLCAILAKELGTDPSHELWRMHEEILQGNDPSAQLTVAADLRPALVEVPGRQSEPGALAIAEPVRPHQLPAGAGTFIGRSSELAWAIGRLSEPDERIGPTIVAIDGAAGIGKSAFALQVAQATSAVFPDGQFYVDLQGASSGLSPRAEADVLAQFLRTLGVRPADVPQDIAQAAGLFRSLLSGRRILIVLDNAASLEQVRPLIPGNSGGAALITSREHLAGLAEAVRIPLRLLSWTDAVTLLGTLCGGPRLSAEPTAAARLASLCGYLPLALRIVGARLASRPDWLLAAYADRLQAARSRLDELAVADLAVRPSLEVTYNGLTEQAQQTFRRLGYFRPVKFSPWVVAALADCSLTQAEQLLDELVGVHLVETSGRVEPQYHLHDLVRLYAQELAMAEPDHARTAAVRRLVGACLSLVELANLQLPVDFLGVTKHRLARWSLPRSDLERLTADPRAWFERDRAVLCTAVEDGLEVGAVRLAGHLAVSLSAFLRIDGHLDVWRRVQTKALEAALLANDRLTEARLRRELAELDTLLDRYTEAIHHFEAAYAICKGHDRRYEAACSAGLGYLYRLQGAYDSALKYFGIARDLTLDTANLHGFVYASNGIGVVHLERDEIVGAADRFEECLRLSRQTGYVSGEAQGLRCLGYIERRRGDHVQAARNFSAAKEISDRIGDQLESAHAACWLGEVLVQLGRPFEGRRLLAEALWVERKYHNTWGEAAVMRALARAQLTAGQPAHALRRAEAAAAIWQRLGSPYWLATGLDTLADAQDAQGDQAAAQLSRARASQLRARLGTPDSKEVGEAEPAAGSGEAE